MHLLPQTYVEIAIIIDYNNLRKCAISYIHFCALFKMKVYLYIKVNRTFIAKEDKFPRLMLF